MQSAVMASIHFTPAPLPIADVQESAVNWYGVRLQMPENVGYTNWGLSGTTDLSPGQSDHIVRYKAGAQGQTFDGEPFGWVSWSGDVTNASMKLFDNENRTIVDIEVRDPTIEGLWIVKPWGNKQYADEWIQQARLHDKAQFLVASGHYSDYDAAYQAVEGGSVSDGTIRSWYVVTVIENHELHFGISMSYCYELYDIWDISPFSDCLKDYLDFYETGDHLAAYKQVLQGRRLSAIRYDVSAIEENFNANTPEFNQACEYENLVTFDAENDHLLDQPYRVWFGVGVPKTINCVHTSKAWELTNIWHAYDARDGAGALYQYRFEIPKRRPEEYGEEENRFHMWFRAGAEAGDWSKDP